MPRSTQPAATPCGCPTLGSVASDVQGSADARPSGGDQAARAAPARPCSRSAAGSTSCSVAGSSATLTLVSAPAGFGKTTLLGNWLAAGAPRGSTAWVSLDERDRDPSSFWTYVLLAVDRAAPETATAALGQLQSGQAPIDVVLTALLNELSVLPDDLTLVLDDYHLAEGPDIQPGMVFLLDHLPPQVHVVISTRADPALPLARLRARGELVEVRAADLRFTGDEAAAYLNDINALGLDAGRRRRPGEPHRGMGGGPAAGGAVPAGPGRPRRSSSPGSPATTGSSWTTSPTRSSTGSRRTCAGSCWTPRSSTG